MSTDLITLDEASWRLEQSNISGNIFAELLCKIEKPLLVGLMPGRRVSDPVDLSRVVNFRAEPENVILAGTVRWTEIKLRWGEIRAEFDDRGFKVSWSWHRNITPELLERAGRADATRPRLDDLRPWRYPRRRQFLRGSQGSPTPPRRASREWFAAAVYASIVPVSGKAPQGKRGPKSGKRENARAAMRQALAEKELTEIELSTMPEKLLADRFGVSRDTARKAKFDVLESIVENSRSTIDK